MNGGQSTMKPMTPEPVRSDAQEALSELAAPWIKIAPLADSLHVILTMDR